MPCMGLFLFGGGLLFDLGAYWDKGLSSDLDQGLTIDIFRCPTNRPKKDVEFMYVIQGTDKAVRKNKILELHQDLVEEKTKKRFNIYFYLIKIFLEKMFTDKCNC